MRLTRAELRRLYSRRLVLATMLAGLAVTMLLLFSAWQSSQPLSAAEQARAQVEYERALADWEANGERYLADCRDSEAQEEELTGTDQDFGCDAMTAPQEEWFGYRAPPLEESLPAALGTQSYLLVALAGLIGITFTAAELSTGAVSTWLTFEPRRWRVYAAKLLAAAAGVAPVAGLLLVLVVAGAWVIARGYGLAGGMVAAEWGAVAMMALRVGALTLLAVVAGAALGVMLRHTAAVLGVAVGYVVVVESMFASALGTGQAWLLGHNLEAWTTGRAIYVVERCTTTATGTTCDYVDRTVTLGQAVPYLLLLTALLVALTGWVFRRRDAA